jgi:hypothetical protein
MRRLLLTLCLFAGITLLSGCYRPLFGEDLPRNQYVSYDEARKGPQPLENKDAFGNPTPALQRRLGQD